MNAEVPQPVQAASEAVIPTPAIRAPICPEALMMDPTVARVCAGKLPPLKDSRP